MSKLPKELRRYVRADGGVTIELAPARRPKSANRHALAGRAKRQRVGGNTPTFNTSRIDASRAHVTQAEARENAALVALGEALASRDVVSDRNMW